MDIEKTNNLQMPLLIPNQSGKEVTHNEALIIIDNLLKNVVVDKDLTEPPANVNDNDLYIVGANASGDWINMDKYLAFYDNGWRFIEPRENFIFYVLDENKFYKYSNNDWIELNINIGDLHLSKLGINTSCSSTNRSPISIRRYFLTHIDSKWFENTVSIITILVPINTNINITFIIF